MNFVQYYHINRWILLIPILFSGCYSSSHTVKFYELHEAEHKNEKIRALTKDSTVFTFNKFSFTDSTLMGNGYKKKKGSSEDFDTTLSFSNIIFIERRKTNNWKIVWLIPAAIAVGAGISYLGEPSEFDIRRPIEGSCPYIYSFDGSDYALEGEAFSTSISKAFESESYHILSHLKSANHQVSIQIRNERPETHLINNVSMYAVDLQKANSVVLDSRNRIWPIYHTIPPKSAFDESKDIRNLIAGEDGTFWKSDLTDIGPGSKFKDELQLRFDVPEKVSEATLIVHAINTDLISELFRMSGTVLGDDALQFYYALDHDPELKRIIKDGIDRSSLKVEVKDHGAWKMVDSILPEATQIPFTRAIRLTQLTGKGTLNIRLSSLKNVWHIDSILMDYSRVKELAKLPLELKTVNSTRPETYIKEKISNNDSLYEILLPPNQLDISFDTTPAMDMQSPEYILGVRGYMYEWLPTKNEQSIIKEIGVSNKADRIKLLKDLIQDEDLLLPIIYESWRQTRMLK